MVSVEFVVTDERIKEEHGSTELLPEDELLTVAIQIPVAGGTLDDCRRRAEEALAARLQRLADKMKKEAESGGENSN